MDIRKELPGGEIGISSNEINLMPNSNRGAIHASNDGLGEGADFIVSGVNAVIDAGVDVTLQSGFVFLNGETLKVDAQVVPRTVGTDFYQFLKVTTNPSAGLRDFRDATTKNVYEENRAIAVNVASITDLAVNGDTMQDVLKTAIQVQSDWNQAGSAEPDFIKNKPSIVGTLLKGTVLVGNIDGSPTGFLTVTGGVTSANKTNTIGSGTEVIVNFASLGTSEYMVILNIIGLGNEADDSQIRGWVLRNRTSTSFKITMKEPNPDPQNLRYDIMIIS